MGGTASIRIVPIHSKTTIQRTELQVSGMKTMMALMTGMKNCGDKPHYNR